MHVLLKESMPPRLFSSTYINDALEGLIDIICVVYLDDILIFSEDPARHEDHVKEVLQRLRHAGLYANLSKCEFSVKRVSFLGFVVEEEERVQAMAEWPVPRSVKDVQIFLGFTGFYRRFIKNYSKIVSALTDCLRKRASSKEMVMNIIFVKMFINENTRSACYVSL
ncbi:hypothetical protein XA68_11303 [Ophiocordyceps unilateralis]|uniref:Reverse transcriptase domain-containing protein n=1 Tax=Ophiocordyceps unilateralis TaxID=268505 RepID=A0A2A9PH45_OPHUN|nr:hypothetical protein XA68_11303 [Ophiocordyceps unilateralis]